MNLYYENKADSVAKIIFAMFYVFCEFRKGCQKHKAIS